MLRQPSFPADEFAKLQREKIAERESKRTDPEAIARLAVRRYGNPYPATDPRYVPTVDEAVALVRNATVEDLKRFHQTFVGGTGQIAIVGDFDPAQIRALLEREFGTWGKARAAYARVPDPLVKKAPTVLTLETPDKSNAALFGSLTLPASDEAADYGAARARELHAGRQRELAAVEAHPGARRPFLRHVCLRRLELRRSQLHAVGAGDLRSAESHASSPPRSRRNSTGW